MGRGTSEPATRRYPLSPDVLCFSHAHTFPRAAAQKALLSALLAKCLFTLQGPGQMPLPQGYSAAPLVGAQHLPLLVA